MKRIYTVDPEYYLNERCLDFAVGIERQVKTLQNLTLPEILSQMEMQITNIKTCQELGFSNELLVSYLNKIGALSLLYLDTLEVV